jgi:hypothetical protein
MNLADKTFAAKPLAAKTFAAKTFADIPGPNFKPNFRRNSFYGGLPRWES